MEDAINSLEFLSMRAGEMLELHTAEQGLIPGTI